MERLVSLYNDVKKIRRSGLSEETERSIAFKSNGVANWDRQPAVAKFLTEKKHGGRQPLIKTDIKKTLLTELQNNTCMANALMSVCTCQ